MGSGSAQYRIALDGMKFVTCSDDTDRADSCQSTDRILAERRYGMLAQGFSRICSPRLLIRLGHQVDDGQEEEGWRAGGLEGWK